ncbi:MAG: cyclic nucleotide-binding domain-containing protein [Candidatus Solibacter sp.]|nr:cyclic nucleotide-binding domain-containing protein [Candidatus Solibacter sp.]
MTSETVVLDRCPFFEQFQPKHLDKLMMLGTQVHFTAGDIIFREGDEAPQFYVLLSGRVALEASFGGRQVRIDTLYGGDELGWSAVLQRKKQFQARALESVQALVFEVSGMRDAFDGNPYFGRAFLERLLTVVAERLQNTRLQLAAALAEAQAASKPPS